MNAEYAVWSAIDQEDDELMKQGKTKSKYLFEGLEANQSSQT